ncbi:MAG: MarR family transcriptional regulator [bacterium]|nr:MarR family transcriptional regulator [bacterium]
MEDINDVILFQIDKTSKVSKLYSQREFDKLDFGITIEQWILLKIIEESGQLSQKELAEKSLRDPASITRTLDILQKKGYITREAVENNRRQYHIILTNDGAQFVKKHMKVVKEHRAKSIEGFTTEEVELLRSMLLRIQKNFS